MPYTFQAVFEEMKELVSTGHYEVSELTDEDWREVTFDGFTIRIEKPIALIRRRGGSTHRVVAADGSVYCYVAPESGKSVIRWMSNDKRVAF